MAFLAPKVSLPSDLNDNTPGRSATQSPAEVLPLALGRGRLVVQWVTPVLHWKFRNTSTSSFAFFSCFGWICAGPVDEIVQIIVNDKTYNGIFALRAQNPGDFIDHTVPKLTPEKFRFWWGSEAAANYSAYLQSLVLDPAHPMKTKFHPNYRGIFALAVQDMEAGRSDGGKTPPLPKVEIEFVRRAPRAVSFGNVPHGTHLLAAAHDVLTLKRCGLGMDPAILATANWDAKITQLHTQGLAGIAGADLFGSPLIAEQRPALDHVAEILGYVDAHLRERDGKLEVDYQPNDGTTTSPAGLRTISLQEMGAGTDPEIDPEGLDGLPTKVVVTGLDMSADPPLTEASEDANVPFARRIVGEDRPAQQVNQRFWVTRRQIKAAAQLRAINLATPPWTARVPVLRQYAVHPDGVTPLLPGDRFDLDRSDLQLDLVVRIIERSDESDTHVVFRVVRERGAFPRPYEPPLDGRVSLTVQPPSDLARFAVAEAPVAMVDVDDPALIPLVERPSNSALSYEVHYSPTNTWPGQVIGSGLMRWAVGARLATALPSNLVDVTVTVDTVGVDWTYVASQSTLAQSDDQLLLQRAGEWCSIGAITPLGGGSYQLALKRGRLGSLPVAHAVGQIAFIAPRADLLLLRHADLANIEAGGIYDAGVATKWLKLRPANQSVQGNLTAAFSLTLSDPTPGAVGGLTAAIGTGQVVDLQWTALTGSSVAEYQIERATGPAYADAAVIAEVGGTRFTDIRLLIGTTYRYRVRAITTDEVEGAWSGSVFATPAVVGDAALDLTPPGNPAAPVKTGGSAYLSDPGTPLAFALITVGALPVRAIGQYLHYRLAGGSWQIRAVGYAAAGENLRLDDLSPGKTYDIAAQAFTINGVPSAMVAGASFVSPTRGGSAAPNGMSFRAGNTAGPIGQPPPALFGNSGQLGFAATITISPSPDRDVVAYHLIGTGVDTNGAADLGYDTNGPDLVISASTLSGFYYALTAGVRYIRARAINSSKQLSGWVAGGDLSAFLKLPSGDLVEQSASNVDLTGGKVALPGFEANVTTATDVKGVNFRVFNAAGAQEFRVDAVTGEAYVQGTKVLGPRVATTPATLADVIAVLQSHGLSN